MLKNILSNPKSKSSAAKNSVLADLRRVLKTGRRVGFKHEEQMLGRAIVVGIEADRLLFEPLGPIENLMSGSVISNIERGIPWDFRIQALQQIREGSDVYLQCEIPTRININSRRTDFRVMTPASEVYELRFEIEERQYETKMLDLSRTGTQVSLVENKDHSLEIDQVVELATLDLDGYQLQEVKIKICWIIEDENSTNLGVEFLDLSSAESDDVYRLICEIEREMIRRLKSLEK